MKTGDLLVQFDFKKLQEKLEILASELATAEKELEKVKLEEKERLDQYILEQAERAMKADKARRKMEQPEQIVSLIELKRLELDWKLAKTEKEIGELRIDTQKKAIQVRIRSSQNRIERLRQEIAQTEASIQKMILLAPKAGLVVYVSEHDEKKPSVGESVWFGQTLMELPDLSRMQVAAVIPEPDAGKVHVGQSAEIRLDASPDQVFTGKIDSLGRIVRSKARDNPSMVFDAVISIENPDPLIMRPGMAAEVTIFTDSVAKEGVSF